MKKKDENIKLSLLNEIQGFIEIKLHPHLIKNKF